MQSTAADACRMATGSSGLNSGAAIGVLQNDPDSGQAASVRRIGRTLVSAGGSVAIGDMLTCSTGGQAIEAATTGQFCWGRANTASTAAGQIIEADVNFFPTFYFVTGGTA